MPGHTRQSADHSSTISRPTDVNSSALGCHNACASTARIHGVPSSSLQTALEDRLSRTDCTAGSHTLSWTSRALTRAADTLNTSKRSSRPCSRPICVARTRSGNLLGRRASPRASNAGEAAQHSTHKSTPPSSESSEDSQAVCTALARRTVRDRIESRQFTHGEVRATLPGRCGTPASPSPNPDRPKSNSPHTGQSCGVMGNRREGIRNHSASASAGTTESRVIRPTPSCSRVAAALRSRQRVRGVLSVNISLTPLTTPSAALQVRSVCL
ncbi:hypothetical protein K466DRAFT_387461 [Polyporus arcularius HHB13444]|uniref:Uncharacterized protein n=1 Tax=Polyporus arcularius HHB13444 TaxID=1314778 RepID=A0A5C3NU22_9APHY|nr:hypothetical protein K466DRAFT_387461 [Polyporus arcularius HHB13444]